MKAPIYRTREIQFPQKIGIGIDVSGIQALSFFDKISTWTELLGYNFKLQIQLEKSQ